MGDWWIDESPWPGPASHATVEDVKRAYLASASRIGKKLQGMSVLLSISDEASARIAEAARSAYELQPEVEAKVPKPVNHVGPRSKFQFDHRGRRTY